MTTNTATGNDATDTTETESNAQLTQLLHRVEALEAENERLQGELDSVREQHREDRHVLARENHDLRKSHDQLRERVKKAETKDSHLLDDIIDLEAHLDTLEERVITTDDPDTEPTTETDLTPIERVSMLGTEEVGLSVTPSIERAVTIFEHWEDWSEKTPKGRVLKDGLKTLLRTARDEQLAWRQVYRAAEALEELSKGRIQLIDHTRHGKLLVEPPRDDCQASSAPTG